MSIATSNSVKKAKPPTLSKRYWYCW